MKPIAATRHTILVTGIFLGVTLLGAWQARAHPPTGTPSSHVQVYLGAIAFEWLLLWGTLRGLKAYGTPVSTLIGPRGPRALLFGALAWPLVFGLGMAAKWALEHAGIPVAAESGRVVMKLLPHGALEIALWIVVSLSAGICEEFVFRGYLMRQFAAWFGGWPGGLVASAFVFAIGHAYQGVGPVLSIFVFGVSFGLVVLLTRGLVPAMTAHALQDVVAGLTGG